MRILRITLWGFGILSLPLVASAHAFGQQFNLPLPVNFYVVGGICAFIASCVILLLFSEPLPRNSEHSESPRGIPVPYWLRVVLRSVGIFFFVACILLAVIGTQDFLTNPLPNFFWIIFLLSFTYITGLLLGGQWRYIDPFFLIASVVADDTVKRPAPRWLPYLPIVWLFALYWLELYSNALGAYPIVIGTVIIFLAAADNIGSSLWGLKTWFGNANLFNTFFDLVSRVAPFQIHKDRIVFVFPGERLVREEAQHVSILLFTLLFLGSTVLDGLRETRAWSQFLQLFPFGWDNYIGLALLALVPLILFGLYSLVIYVMTRVTHSEFSFGELRLTFAFSLVPIAVAYHFAHYFSLILSQGQLFFAQISDPLYKGWNIFGTANYQMNLGLVGADQVWYVQLSAIVLGHILGAIVAHFKAQRTFRSKRDIIVSQLPILVLMIGLTALGLWTLSQPFVR